MPTQFVVEARKIASGIGVIQRDGAVIDRAIDLVEEYGDAILSLTCGGSEFFRKNGSEVDAAACVEYVQRVKRGMQDVIIKKFADSFPSDPPTRSENDPPKPSNK